MALFQIGAAQANAIPAPDLKAGQFVYTVPADFDPPYIGKAGLDEIQQEARKLHNPYYVLVVKDYGGSTTEQLSDAIDELAETWTKNPKFNRATSSIAILSYSPRKYRFLAGSKWRAQLGLEGQGGQRFVDIFSSYTQGSSKDPKTGIIESMKAVDAFVFESTDPKLLTQKAEAERKARAEQQLREATAQLNNQISRAESLLNDQPEFLPPDTSRLREALSKAKTARSSNNPTQILNAVRELQSPFEAVAAFAGDKRHAYEAQIAEQQRVSQQAIEAKENERKRLELQMMKRNALFFIALILLGGLIFWQWQRYSVLVALFKEKTAAWEESLLNAANNYARFFEERRNVTELAATSGKTKKKYDEVTHEVGAIYPTIEAMRDRIAECKILFGQGSFFRVKPLQQALALLDAEFEFDTQTMNRKSLFEPPVRIIKVKPVELQDQLQRLYAENISDWDELMQALQMRETIAQDAFSADSLTQMLELASQKGVPHRWLSSHPLFGDDESDRRFYDDLNATRLFDPLDYKQNIDSAIQSQNELNEVLKRLIAALALVESKRVRVLPAYGETIVATQDDPAATLASAFRDDERLAGFLASKTSVEEVEEQANLTAGLYVTAVEQAATLQAAIQGVQGDIASLGARLDSVRQLQSRAQSRLRDARTIHADTSAAATSLASGEQEVDSAENLYQEAQWLLSEKRHLEAQQGVQQANNHLASAENNLNQSLRFCDELDEQKRAYELQVSSLANTRADAESSMRRYGRHQQFNDFNHLHDSGPVNYGLLMIQVNEYQQQLEEEVRNARRAYEEEQARIEREREAERQRERDEERRRDSSSGSSWSSSDSSSSGSSWDSGSSSSSSSSSGSDW